MSKEGKNLFAEVYGPAPKPEGPAFGDSDDRFNDGEHYAPTHGNLAPHTAPPEYDPNYETYRTEGG